MSVIQAFGSRSEFRMVFERGGQEWDGIADRRFVVRGAAASRRREPV